MPDNDLIEIKISRVIPAPRWRVIRLLTRVWEFPSFVPTIKEAKVLQKHHNRFITKWLIKVDNISIQWTEEDTIVLDKNLIEFRATDGDLQEFRGQWNFSDHPHGCEVSVTIYFKVLIPVIKDFAQDYVKKIVTKNFEAILESVEQRLVSVRYASYKKGDSKKIAGFGIIGHFYNFKHFESYLKILYPDFKMPSLEFIGQLFHVTPSFKAYDILDFKSQTGETVNGCFILATYIPDMVQKDIYGVFAKIVKACRIAEKHGMGIVSLGGYSSIVLHKLESDITSQVDIPVTTGKSFTAAMVLDGIAKALHTLERDSADTKVAVIGGTGDIGTAVSRVLVDKVKQITLTGVTKEHLKKLSSELKKKRKAGIAVCADNREAVKDADLVITAASAASSILDMSWFKPGAIVADVGYPKNVSYLSNQREDIFIFDAGLSQSPSSLHLPINVGLPSPYCIFGSFAEAIILDLEKRYENFSHGTGNIYPEKIDEIRTLGKRHGFVVSDFFWNDKKIEADAITKIKEIKK